MHNLEKEGEEKDERIKRLNRENDSLRYRLEEEAIGYQNRINELRRGHEVAETILRDELTAKAANLKAEARREVEGEVEALKQKVSDAEAFASGAAGENTELRTSLAAHVTQVASYKELVTAILAKLPNVDMSKFNVNVDIAPADVTVVNGQAQVKKN